MTGKHVIARRCFRVRGKHATEDHGAYTRVFRGVVVGNDWQNPSWYRVRLANCDTWFRGDELTEVQS